MKLDLTAKYKSLEPPISIELPPLTIITGLNGAGKTQLLTGLNAGAFKLTQEEIELNPKKYVPSNSLSPNNSVVVTRQQLNQKTQQLWTKYSQFFKQKNISGKRNLQNFITNEKEKKVVEYIAKESGKALETDEITVDDFYRYYPIDDGLGKNDVFFQNFSNVFKRYNDKYIDNKFSKYLNKDEGHSEVSFLQDGEFSKLYGEPPWEFVNKIIKEANLDYYINSPLGIEKDAPFELKLINNFNKAEIQFSELSSGEKVIMSLALALYNSETDTEFPKVLLLDEPDASLHPSMTKQFLNVLENVFVKGKGAFVIITTHSPSTIALAKEEFIFAMNKTAPRIEKTSKDKALKILTAGVPSFSVNYENRRQVFVESPFDVIFYEGLYQRLSKFLIPEISLSFISSGESRTDKNGIKVSNCDQVVNITSTLRKAGNNFIWGIIDWDGNNKTTDFIKVLGNGNRYSIENYLLDPLLVSAFLLREKIISGEDLGLTKDENYSEFKNLTQPQLQIISDFFKTKISVAIKPTDSNKVKVKYLNELEIEIPQWYLLHQGHELETHLKNTFQKLNEYSREGELKKEIITKVIDDFPELIPKDILEIFQSIQTH